MHNGLVHKKKPSKPNIRPNPKEQQNADQVTWHFRSLLYTMVLHIRKEMVLYMGKKWSCK